MFDAIVYLALAGLRARLDVPVWQSSLGKTGQLSGAAMSERAAREMVIPVSDGELRETRNPTALAGEAQQGLQATDARMARGPCCA